MSGVAFAHAADRVERDAAAREREALHVPALRAAQADDALLREHVQARPVNA